MGNEVKSCGLNYTPPELLQSTPDANEAVCANESSAACENRYVAQEKIAQASLPRSPKPAATAAYAARVQQPTYTRIDIAGWLQGQPLIVQVPIAVGLAAAGCGGEPGDTDNMGQVSFEHPTNQNNNSEQPMAMAMLPSVATPEPDMSGTPDGGVNQPDMSDPNKPDMSEPQKDMTPLPQKPIELNANKTSTLNNFGTTLHRTAYGDVDGDGKLDFVVGTAKAAQVRADEGALRIISDFNNRLPNAQAISIQNAADVTIWGEGGNYGLGASIYLSDVNGDGKVDTFAGADGYKGLGGVFRINGRSMADLKMLPTMKQISLALDNNQNAQGVSILVGSANDVGGLGIDIKPAPGSNVLFVGAGNFIRIVPDANFQGKITVDQMKAVEILDRGGDTLWVYAPLGANRFATANSSALQGNGLVKVTDVTKPPMPAELDISWQQLPNGVTVRRLEGAHSSQAGFSMAEKNGMIFVGVPTDKRPDNNGAVVMINNMPQNDGMLDQMGKTKITGKLGTAFGSHVATYEKGGKASLCALAPDNNDAALYLFEDAASLAAGTVAAEDVATKIYRNVNLKGAHNLTCVDGFASYETLGGDVVVVRTQ